MTKHIILLLICVLTLSCKAKYSQNVLQSLELAGDNREELENVISHYEKHEGDSLKLKAAMFLISNMKFHASDRKLNYADKVFEEIGKMKIDTNVFENETRRNRLKKKLDSLNLIFPDTLSFEYEKAPDLKHLKSDFLINNIDLAFESWLKIPITYRANFKDFCNYVLPYRSGMEPVSIEDRRELMTKYSWVNDSLRKGVAFEKILGLIKKQIHFRVLLNMRSIYPQTLSVLDFDKIKVGLCLDGVTYFVHVLRALGIPAADDYVPHWGNHYTYGHDWLFVRYGKKDFHTDIAVYWDDPSDLLPVFKDESIPKIYRRSFVVSSDISKTIRHSDVTAEYIETYSPRIPLLLNKSDDINAKICVFDQRKGWDPIDDTSVKNTYLQAQKLGKNVIYMAGYFKDNLFYPINYPFTFDKNTHSIHFFSPTVKEVCSAIIDRKYPLFSKRYQTKRTLIDSLNGCFFEGSNDSSFQKKITLYTIKGLKSLHMQRVNIMNSAKLKYIRFYSPKSQGYVAELLFFDKKNKVLSGKVIKSHPSFKDTLNDNKPETYFGGKNQFIGLQLAQPTSIGAIEFQTRNDGNQIYKGDEYELFYWDKDWVSLKRQQAMDTVLYFSKVPQNALLLLKNITKGGKEEHVFIMGKNKRQYWIGSHIK